MGELLNQPFDGQLGDILIEKLNGNYNKCVIVSAFAKNSGVLRMKPALEQFRQRGGLIEAYIGVDAHGTSYEAALNLFHLCNRLYIVHSESNSTTFHSKVYKLSNDESTWMAVGSNNLTGGGFWTNIESCVCYDIPDNQSPDLVSFNRMTERFQQNADNCSMLIDSQDQIDDLLTKDYLRREVRLAIEQNTAQNPQNTRRRQNTFGTIRGIRIPHLVNQNNETAHHGTARANENRETPANEATVHGIQAIEETNETERIWFETRAMTGGSRNILDLSKMGTIVSGSAVGSRYETTDANIVLGGVAFFDINPERIDVIKDITVNYNGVDYYPCTIKFAPDNGSWRIQLKGADVDNHNKIHLVGGINWIQRKILVFEKIRTDYYVLSSLNEDELDTAINNSYVVATNGTNARSKKYGLLR